VTNESLLGERVIGIDPGTPEEPPLKEGAVVDGVDPPRLDLALALAYELLTHIVDLFRNHEEDIEALVTGAASTVTALDEVLTEHRPRIDRIFENVESATVEAGALVTRTRERIDSPQVQRILDNLDHSLAALDRDLGPILSDTRRATTKVNDTLDTFGPKEREQVRTTLRRVSALTDKADGVLSDAQAIVEHVRAGRGTVGAAVMDEELYDDIQELLRDLKHNPWKLFWRE
jgi:phospholipid/cholesterol/gamma-HCH transport system substrate-binding protein